MKKLFEEFPPVPKQDWIEKAKADLKGADFDKKLVWNTYEGFAVQPFYTEEDLAAIQPFADAVAAVQKTQPGWIANVRITEREAAAINKKIEWAIRQGATGVVIDVSDPGSFDFNTALKSTDPSTLHIGFCLPAPSPAFVEKYFAYLSQRKVALTSVHGFCDANVFSHWLTTGTPPDFSALAAQLNLTSQAPHFYGLVLHGEPFVNAGGNSTQEIAFLLNQLTDSLEALQSAGLQPESLLREVYVHSAAGGDYFFEIAKLRALRLLLHNIQKVYTKQPVAIPVLVTNASWSKTIYDPNVNMLRNTTEAMAAVLGGCDALLIAPHDEAYETPTEFSARIALNISHLLQGEAYLDKVLDPAKGSYYIEAITKALAEQALALFKEIEQLGGFVQAAKSGLIQQHVEEVCKRKLADVATRKQTYVGVNQYVNIKEKNIIVSEPIAPAGTFRLLQLMRATHAYEQLRTQTESYHKSTGHRPSVYLVSFGNLAMRKARASFSTHFFASAGFEVSRENFYENPLQAVDVVTAGPHDLVVLCSSDDDYATHAKTFAEAFRTSGTSKTLVLAGYPPALVDELKAAGIDLFIHVKSNVVDVISGLQKKFMAAV
jgi:methylmalonyl-CoA mutase